MIIHIKQTTMPVLITISILLMAMQSCKKQEADDFNGNGNFAGKLVCLNPNSGELVPKPLANRKVYLAYVPSDTLNYIYSVTTNNEGYFVFTNADKSRKYDIFFSDTLGTVWYKAVVTETADKDDILLLATPDQARQNGIAATAQDVTGAQIKDVTVSGYDSHDIFVADSIAGTNAGAVFSFATNIYGKNTAYNLRPGVYYLIARKQAGPQILAGYNKTTVGYTGITPVTMLLKTGEKPYGLTIGTIDATGSKIEGVTVNVYDNHDLFRADSAANTATGAVKTVITGASGYDFWQNAPAGNYHFIAQKTAGSLVLAGYKHQMLAAYVADTATIRLAPVTALNTLNITIHDTDNNAINDATGYLYTSSVVASLDTMRTAFTYSVSTSAAGTATKTNMPAATYYLYARKIIGSDTLAGTGSIFVPATGTINMPPLKIR